MSNELLTPGWRRELIRIAKCERPEITPEMAQAAMLHIENLEAASSETNAHRELIRDASRYRWLREAKFLEIVTDNQMFRIAGGDNLDKTIDVAATP